MLLKIKSYGFRPNNERYEKMLRTKIVHLKKIYNFDFDHFFDKTHGFCFKREKCLLKIKNSISRINSATYETNLKEQNYSF